MSTEIRLPQWGMGMTEGEIIEWLKGAGETVAEDEDICEVEAEKTSAMIVAPAAGALRIVVQEGETVPIYSVICYVDEPDGPS